MAHLLACQRHLQRLRGWRNPDRRPGTLGPVLEQMAKELKRPQNQMEQLRALWQAHVPAELRAHSQPQRLHRGTLYVHVDSSSHLYRLDRTLKSGLQHRLIRAHRGSLQRIKLKRAPLATAAPPPQNRPNRAGEVFAEES